MRIQFNSMALAMVILCAPALSYAWNPCFSILGNFTATGNSESVKSGTFSIRNRNVNLGFELTNKFYLNEQCFVRTGLRYNTYKTTVGNAAQAFPVLPLPYQIEWETGFVSLAVPVQIGKELVTAGGSKGEIFAGVTLGLFTPLTAGAGVTTGPGSNAGSGQDSISTRIPDFSEQTPISFLASADIGVRCQPFRNAPRVSLGLLCSAQLTRSKAYSYEAVVSDAHGHVNSYDMRLQQQFVNFAISLSYTFGRLKSATYMLPQSISIAKLYQNNP